MFKKIIRKIKIIFIPCEKNNYRPKFLDSNFLFYYLGLLVLLRLVIFPVLIHFPGSAFFASLTQQRLINLTNESRTSLGLNYLQENSVLNQIALNRAQDMLALDYFGHKNPEGKEPWYWFKKAGYQYQKAGENLAIGFFNSENVFQAWKDSPSHKKNIVNPHYEDIGIAVLQGMFEDNKVTVVVQVFGTELETITKRQENYTQNIEEKQPKESKGEEKIKEEQKEEQETEQEEEIGDEGAIYLPFVEGQDAQYLGLIEDKPESATMKIFSFITIHYSYVIEKIIFYSLLLIIITLLFTILVKVNLRPKDLIAKGLFMILIFVLFSLLDKDLILRFIPHSLNIG